MGWGAWGEGPWGAGRRFFGPGEIRIALLSLLADGPAHGYELMTRLRERSAGAYEPSAGTVYPALAQLEDEGLVRVQAQEGKKIYELTREGRKEVAGQAREAENIWRRADAWGEWGSLGHPEGAEILGPALRLAKAALAAVMKSHGDPAVIEGVREVLEEARAALEDLGKRGRRR
jgi:DNA-binding PadR family transcriptional regulator